MNFEIRALSPSLLEDYMNYFDNVAFTDHQEWSGCYCVHFHWNDLLQIESNSSGVLGEKLFNRKQAAKFVVDGTLKGYLAYLDDAVVGWCNTNDKSSYAGLSKEQRPEIWDEQNIAEKVKSVVCFTIAPDMRGKGVATRLLDRVCLDAAAQGYMCIEAYPHKGDADIYVNHHGPYPLYQKSGFSIYKDLMGPVIVRKYL